MWLLKNFIVVKVHLRNVKRYKFAIVVKFFVDTFKNFY